MKTFYVASILLLFLFCGNKKSCSENEVSIVTDCEIVMPALKTIIDSAHVNGSILIYELKDNRYYLNDFEWAKKGNLPA